jgi:integrase
MLLARATSAAVRAICPEVLLGGASYTPEELADVDADGDFTLDEVGMWLGVCSRAAKTSNLLGVDPRRWWRAIVIFGFNTGLRIDTIMSATWEMMDRKKPGWITIPSTIYKGHKRGGEFYVNRHARAAIESIRLRSRERLFPWRGWPSSQRWLQESRRRLLNQSDIPQHRRFGFHGLRGALLTWLGGRNPMIASMVAGHSGRSGGFSAVTRDYYVNPDAVRELLEAVPQPAAREPDPQRFLF